MHKLLTFLFCLFCLLRLPAQNTISITLSSETYDCLTGKLTLGFHISNSDGTGTPNFHSNYSIQTGSVVSGLSSVNSSEADLSWTGDHVLGNMVTINAWGISNNSAPLGSFSYTPSNPGGPATPTINLPALPLCNGVYGTMTANGTGGNFVWSSGGSGNTLTTNVAGTWTVHESNYCGVSPESSPATITTNTTPAAPSISSSAGAVLCNGVATTLSSNPGYGGILTWLSGETANSISVNAAGTYSVRETNACGTGAFSAGYLITTASTPPAPVLNLNGAQLLCDGASQNIITSPVSAGGVIHWSTGATANGINVTAAGTYYAYEYNPYCGASQNSANVVITTSTTPIAPTISPAGPVTLCNGNATTLNTFGLGTISWYKDGADYGPTDNQTTVSTAGNYYAHCSNACGVSGNSNTVTVLINSTPPAPNLNVSGAITLCDGAGQSLVTAASTSGGVIHWSNGITANSQTVTAAGGYYAWETNPSCGTGANSATVNITTLSKPTAPLVTPNSNQLLCNGSTTTISSSGANITWSNGTTGNTLNTGTAGNYYTYDRNYCGNSPNSNTVTITTATCPPPTPGTSFSICPSAQKTLDAGAGYDTYLWSNGQTTRTVSVGPGTYTVTVTKYGCSATSNAVTVSNYTITTPTITTSGSTTICSGDNVTLTSSGGTAYLWSNGNTTNNITVGNAGGYFVRVTDNNGCNTTSNTTTLTVRPLPTASILGNAEVCRNFTPPVVRFSGANATAPYTFTYRINGGSNQTVTTSSGNTINVNAPTNIDGTFLYELIGVKESSSTTCSALVPPSAGASATVTVNPLPTATISGTTTVCQGSLSPQVSFTASGGTAPYTITYQINDGPLLTTGTAASNPVYIGAPTNLSGTYTYSLVSVQDNSNTHCINTVTDSSTITVNPLPNATIAGNSTICQSSSMPLITFTGGNAIAPYTFYYAINGGQTQTISSLGTIVTVPVTTATAGSFTYSMISVEESSITHCSNKVAGSAVVNINPLPTATITGTTTVCQNTLSPNITLTATGGTAPYTFIYSVNGGPSLTARTSSGNSVAIGAPTNNSGIYTYSLISVQESSSTNCSNAVSGTATITINPLPRAAITGTTTICQNSPAPQLTFTGSNATAPYTFYYQLNGTGMDSIIGTANAVTMPVPTAAAGTYNYSLISVKESTSTACADLATGSSMIKVNPLPSATIIGTNTVCQNSFSPTITIKGLNATAPYTFEYSINGGPLISFAADDSLVKLSVPTNTPGTYRYQLLRVVESSSTQCANSISGAALITINQQPTATMKGADTVCQFSNPIPITFTATGGTAPYTFTYQINGGPLLTTGSLTGQVASISAPTNLPGSFTYTLISVQESSSTQCLNLVPPSAGGTTTVHIHPQRAKAVLVAPKQHLCNGEASPITIYNYTAGNTYTWYLNGSQFRTSTNDTIMNKQAGQFQVLSTSDKGCDAATISDIISITTGTITKPIITGSTRVCDGGKTKLLVVPETVTLSYETINWNYNGKSVSKQLAYTASAGNYEIKVGKEGCRDSTLLAVTNNDTIFPRGTLTASSQHIPYGSAIELTAAIDSAIFYRWDFGDGNTASTTTNQVQQHFYKASDSLTIKLNAVSERNCISQFTTWIKVDPPDSTRIPNLSMAGKLKDWNLYPIPFHDRLRVSIVLLKDEPIRIDAFSNAGQWVRSWQCKGIAGENLFDLDKLASLPSNLSYLFVAYYSNTKHTSTAYKF